MTDKLPVPRGDWTVQATNAFGWWVSLRENEPNLEYGFAVEVAERAKLMMPRARVRVVNAKTGKQKELR